MNLTVIIPTIFRPVCCITIVDAWLHYFSDVAIIVVDSGETPELSYSLKKSQYKNVNYISTNFDVGLAKARNIGKNLAETDYLFFNDDDNLPPTKTLINLLLDLIEKNDIDILGPKPKNLNIYNNTLHIKKQPRTYIKCDMVANHFLCKNLQSLNWDENIKFAYEHWDFFLMTKKNNLNIYSHPSIQLKPLSFRYSSKKYMQHRQFHINNLSNKNYFYNKWQIKKISHE